MFDNQNKKESNLNIISEPTILLKDKKDSKCPIIISQTSGYLDSQDDNISAECLLTVIELNDGSPRIDCSESCLKSNVDKPKKFRINLIKCIKKNHESRKNKLLEEKESYESRLKRFPGYMIGNLNGINQGDYEKPISSNSEINENRNIGKHFSANISSSLSVKPKLKSEKLVTKVKYSCQNEALIYFENLSEIKIKTEDNFDQMMIKKFPIGSSCKDKIYMKIIYVPECEILRKQFIGFYGLNFEKFNVEEFEGWCHKHHFYNSKWMYESYFNNGHSRECSFILNGLMTKYQVGIILSDFFRTGNSAAYRAVAIFGEHLLNIDECIEEFKSKLPINIMPYLHENPNDESSLAPDDYEEIDYFRRNYHRIMFSDDVYF